MATCGLHGIIGNKGAGKSMLMVKMLVRTLLDTTRTVITNLPIKWTELLEYLRERRPDFTNEELLRRLIIITDISEIRRFWLHRGLGWALLDVPEDAWKTGQVTDYTVAYRWLPTVDPKKRKRVPDLTPREAREYCDAGELEMCDFITLPHVQYIWDEMQNVYPARAWTSTPPSLLWHLTQQRKVSDDIVVASQRPKLMEVQFRELMDDWLFLTNWGKKRKGWFRLPKAMSWSQYDQLPGPGIKPMVTGHARIDISGIGELYDTSAGTNIIGGMLADTAEKPSGLHWGWFFVAFGVLALALWILPGHFLKFIGDHTRSTVESAQRGTRGGAAGAASAVATAVGVAPVVVQPAARPFTAPAKPAPVESAGVPTEKKLLTGIFVLNGTCTAFFDDGSSLASNEVGFQGVIKRGGKYVGVRAFDQVYHFHETSIVEQASIGRRGASITTVQR